jgi:hypothetical protein
MKYLMAFLAAVAAHLSAFGAANNPDDVVEAFYRWVLTHHVAGLPSPAQRQQLRQLLAPDFLHVLDEAEKAQDRCIANALKDMKPNIWEGSLFVTNYEGANEVWYGSKRIERQDTIIEVNLLGIDPGRKKGDRYRAIAWSDSVRLRKFKHGWLVVDVMRGDSPNSSERESLIGMLRKYSDVDCPGK